MSKQNALTTPVEPRQEPSPVTSTSAAPGAESSAGTAAPACEIAALAYQHWLERGCPEGSPDEDWFFAEQELRRPGGPTGAL